MDPTVFTFLQKETERQHLEDYLSLLIITIGRKAWHQLRFTVTFPHIFFCIFHEDEAARAEGMESAHILFKAMMSAEKYCRETRGPVSKALRKCLNTAYFIFGQFNLRCCLECQRHGWVATNAGLRILLEPSAEAPAATKTPAEDKFNGIRDMSRMNKNKIIRFLFTSSAVRP